ncbi:alanine--tRNA ligase, mitochondrial isoform X2 [Nilaparvata lugens]|uniref:alanine--tRNA ligase, mitochondrial isoform X1 n=1 Tax=Nilaparvata lugens TaxID=108931 RepID=UPI00193E7F68|nr:alanine--tRNA ligase, mitochondrial isoform X1 [Nilaparvata lugens]XP_039289030.1 alanine--tRNA ligase, mitochondrial isoform X2 [Nilaparvata lugens]
MSVTKNTSALIRSTFLDYFIKENGHAFIRSSPVVPFQDPTLSFVNAGMNQFKNVLLGLQKPTFKKIANSQKCIRVGGKHNDLCLVGHDTYHHTFFEMLGNWSFGDYFKKEACSMAWTLLTSRFNIPSHRLYVTYFGGDKELGIPPDLETKEIWKSIGVNSKHILPFGMKDNFWEMGKTGPCGPCTEIHYSYLDGPPTPEKVNTANPLLIELWNIVFIEFNRRGENLLEKLPEKHVDTGMGLERLIAVLQGVKSNYDTDLFRPLFDVISKVSGARPYSGAFGAADRDGLDTAYRILADHSRMSAVALSDNMFPDQNHKLRRIIRKALVTCERNFKMKDNAKLLGEVVNGVADILSQAYPEISRNLNKVQMIIRNESEIIRELNRSTAKEWKKLVQQDQRLSAFTGVEAVGLVPAYRDLCDSVGEKTGNLSSELAVRLYDTRGLDADLIDDLASALGLNFDRDDFDNKLKKFKQEGSKSFSPKLDFSTIWTDTLIRNSVPLTNDSFKYVYEREPPLSASQNESTQNLCYTFPVLTSKLLAIMLLDGSESQNVCLENDEVVLETGKQAALIVNNTNFYSEEGGQEGDKGTISVFSPDGEEVFSLEEVAIEKVGGYVFHFGKLSVNKYMEGKSFKLTSETKANLKIDETIRLAHMRNHTATHLINAALKEILTVSCQKASNVSHESLTFDFSVYGASFYEQEASKLEKLVRKTIASKTPVERKIVSSQDILSMDDIALLPGETYTDSEISVIEIKGEQLFSKEACCGTHVMNTGDIGAFCITGLKSQGSNLKFLQAVTGQTAENAMTEGKEINEKTQAISNKVKEYLGSKNDGSLLSELDNEIQNFKSELNQRSKSASYLAVSGASSILDEISLELKKAARLHLRDALNSEMREVIENCKENFVVHFLKCSSELDSTPLIKATKMCPNIPVMIFSYTDNCLRGRCTIPKEYCEILSAEDWMNAVISVTDATGGAPKGQDPKLVYLMKPTKISKDAVEKIVDNALEVAKRVAEKNFT